MLHLMKYSYKIKMRNFVVMFWPLVFPLLLGIFFKLALGNVSELDSLDVIPVAAVEVEKTDESKVFDEYLTGFEEQEDPIIEVKRVSEKEALTLMKDKEIAGIYYIQNEPELSVNAVGFEQNILETFLESFLDNKNMLTDIAQDHPERMMDAMAALENYKAFTKNVSINGKTLDTMVMFFYALLGMACMYGCFIGHNAVSKLQANISAVGARRGVTPTHKMQLIACELFTAFSMHFVNMLIDIFVLKHIFGVELNGNMGAMILVVLLGSLIGVSFGVCVTSVSKLNDNAKIGIILGITMIACAFAGLYDPSLKYKVDQNIPLLNKLNPPALISDSFYCINVYNDGSRLAMNLLILLILSVVLVTISFLSIRRERYDSI